MEYAVIIAGGKGRRLWPKSVPENPKHLLPIISDKPMLEETIERIEELIPRERVFIVTSADSVGKILELIPNLKKENILGEPVGRNSAPAIAWASAVIAKKDPEAVTVVLPADHYIPDREQYVDDLRKAFDFARKNPFLVTFGIKPTRPDTGYGYIELSERLEGEIYEALRFTEKPDLDTAKEFLKSGNFLWNSGMFVWKAETILNAFQKYKPKMYELISELSSQIGTSEYNSAVKNYYEKIESISIDYAIMEKSERVATVSASFVWDDVGSWQFLTRISAADEQGNIIRGENVQLDTKNCIIYNDEEKIIATIDVENLIIVNTKNGVLVCNYPKAADVNTIVKKIESLKK